MGQPRFPFHPGLLCAACLAVPFAAAQEPGPDRTAEAELLGNAPNQFYPGKKLGSVADLQAFEGRIYIGYGNTNNTVAKKPLYYDPAGAGFGADEPPLTEEVFRRLRIFDGQLYGDGYDPIGGTSHFYRKEGERWAAHPVITPGTGGHNRDIVKFDGCLFTQVGSSEAGFPGIAMSSDDGRTWTLDRWAGDSRKFSAWEFFSWRGFLYVTGTTLGLFDKNGEKVDARDVATGRIPPDQIRTGPSPEFVWMLRRGAGANAKWEVLFSESAEWFSPEDNQGGPLSHFTPFGERAVFLSGGRVFACDRIEGARPRAVHVSEAEGIGFVDLLARPTALYALGVLRPAKADATAVAAIFKSEDMVNWTPEFHAKLPLRATAMEEAGGKFYIGIGSEFEGAHPDSGNLYRIESTAAAR
jgi:hypothetical protein